MIIPVSKWRVIYFVSMCYFCATTNAAIFKDSSSPPPGFESFSASQHLRVSLVFMQKRIGLFFVERNHDKLTFHAPQELMSKLGGINKQNKNLLVRLGKPFNLNIQCRGCPSLTASHFYATSFTSEYFQK